MMSHSLLVFTRFGQKGFIGFNPESFIGFSCITLFQILESKNHYLPSNVSPQGHARLTLHLNICNSCFFSALLRYTWIQKALKFSFHYLHYLSLKKDPWVVRSRYTQVFYSLLLLWLLVGTSFFFYDTLFIKLGLRLSLNLFERKVLTVMNVDLVQLHPNSWTLV